MTTRPISKRTKGARVIKDIRRATPKQYSAGEKIRIVFDGLRSVDSFMALFRQEGIAQSIYYK